MIHIRGWSPFGSSHDTKLPKSDVRDLQERVHAMLTEEDKMKVKRGVRQHPDVVAAPRRQGARQAGQSGVGGLFGQKGEAPR